MAKKKLIAVPLIALLAIAAACSGPSPTPTPSRVMLTTPEADPTATPQVVINRTDGQVDSFEINLSFNGSPQQGTAVFTRNREVSDVVIRLSPGARAQMVTIRRGTCPNPTGFVEEMNNLIGGVLRQQFRDISFNELLQGGLTLVVSADTNSFGTVVACGDFPQLTPDTVASP